MMAHVRLFDHVSLGYVTIRWVEKAFISSFLKGFKSHHEKTEN